MLSPATQKLIDLLESCKLPSGALDEAIAAVRAESEGKPPPLDLGEPWTCSENGFFLRNRTDNTVVLTSLEGKQRKVVADRVNALAGVRNPAAVAELVAELRSRHAKKHTIYGTEPEYWCTRFDELPTKGSSDDQKLS